MTNDPNLKLWAKTGRGGDLYYHPLLYHMLDVAAVATHMWELLSEDQRKRIGYTLGNEARAITLLLAGGHDIGKASPGFQQQVPQLSELTDLQVSVNDQNRPHGFVSACVLNRFFTTVLGQIAGGHHGIFPRSLDLRMGRDILGNREWEIARNGLLQELAKVLKIDISDDTKCKPKIIDPFIIPLLAGLISVADWIGSNQDFFPCLTKPGQLPELVGDKYFEVAKDRADKALHELGWMPGVIFAKEAPFTHVFSGFIPNSLQNSIEDIAIKQTSPYLMIIEAPTGQGKTEAALYAADLALCRGFARGIYIAMPTQATSNAMFKRVQVDYLKNRRHKGKLNLQLVHGNALLAGMGEVREGEISDFKIADTDTGDTNTDMEAQSWFTAKKRPLLSPFGVGTIDQSLLSVLQTRHWFVRLFGLAGKVVIFDEIHAYDAYMITILERLLQWLAEIDCTVILLSATLPEARRKALIYAYSGQNSSENKCYPRITLAQSRHYINQETNELIVCKEVSVEDSHCIYLNFSRNDLEILAGELTRKLEHGGCAAVICDTVDRSIEVFRYLQANMHETECLLFHARTLQVWRREREDEVLRKFGKGTKQHDGSYTNPDRPFRAVLVATQVIEQSLDLDFDLMFSEIAPVDLLLQRIGRLHRHSRTRPEGLEMPQFTILCDGNRGGAPPDTFGKNIEHIYDRYILLRTWLVVRGKAMIEVPAETEKLIEKVYGTDEEICGPDWIEALEKAKRNLVHEQEESQKAASRLLICPPCDSEDIVRQFNCELFDDDDPEVHTAIRAATREGDPSIMLVMVNAGAVLAAEPALDEVRDLLGHSTMLSYKGLYHELASNCETPKGWEKNTHLNHARLMCLDENNRAKIGGYILTVNEKLGIVIEKESKDNG
ncbi:CRISPR-associated protein Cas3 [Dehalococcoides mccartyi]|uniref:CRISPR-associated protein Cas3 n=3 Tax=Dehalococcoidaceae TaxID=1202464 RepID=A0A142VBJ6_9CHLR|nr:CRISPR-associated helicase Cas3 [Dehalococcoides mccartyi DCMB5]AMU87203.1 CRISPR-associated protein Cas3 [Dehalococcoides mccartyi]